VLPLLVALEVCEHTAVSIRTLVQDKPAAGRLRVPRFIHPAQLLRPYDWRDSLGHALLFHVGARWGARPGGPAGGRAGGGGLVGGGPWGPLGWPCSPPPPSCPPPPPPLP
jgi:hypothetical protein